jgi:Family of unknown function (DUF6165)
MNGRSVAGDSRDPARRIAPLPPAAAINVPISPGELLDKISILELKSRRIVDPDKLRNIRDELDMLIGVRDHSVPSVAELNGLTLELRLVNELLWDAEEAIRSLERTADFGQEFVAIARSIYLSNDRRAAIKRQINERLGSRIIEEKSYVAPLESGHERT